MHSRPAVRVSSSKLLGMMKPLRRGWRAKSAEARRNSQVLSLRSMEYMTVNIDYKHSNFNNQCKGAPNPYTRWNNEMFGAARLNPSQTAVRRAVIGDPPPLAAASMRVPGGIALRGSWPTTSASFVPSVGWTNDENAAPAVPSHMKQNFQWQHKHFVRPQSQW